jgi:hypothetical protein
MRLRRTIYGWRSKGFSSSLGVVHFRQIFAGSIQKEGDLYNVSLRWHFGRFWALSSRESDL